MKGMKMFTLLVVAVLISLSSFGFSAVAAESYDGQDGQYTDVNNHDENSDDNSCEGGVCPLPSHHG